VLPLYRELADFMIKLGYNDYFVEKKNGISGSAIFYKKAKFLPNNLIAIDSKIIPKNFLSMAIPVFPSAFARKDDVRKTINIITKLAAIAVNICKLANADFKDKIVVNVPVPAMIGKAIGTTVPDFASGSVLKKLTPSTISNPRINKTTAPAKENDFTSMPIIFRNKSPINKNIIIIAPAESVILSAFKWPYLRLISIIIGKDPTISITANRVKNILSHSLKISMPQIYTHLPPIIDF